MTDGRISGNYSLVFPSLMLNHSGNFECSEFGHLNRICFELLLSPKSDPLTELFSEGDEVVLNCNSNLNVSAKVV